jgi:hypothetical protein
MTARPTTALDRPTCSPISRIEAVSCSAALATVCAFASACPAAVAAVSADAPVHRRRGHLVGRAGHRGRALANSFHCRPGLALDRFGHVDQGRMLFGFGLPAFDLTPGDRLAFPRHMFFEHLHGPSHRADLIAPLQGRNRNGQITGTQPIRRLGDAGNRCDHAPQQHEQDATNDEQDSGPCSGRRPGSPPRGCK